MKSKFRNRIKLYGGVAILAWPKAAFAQSEIIDGWTESLLAASNLVIIGASLLGIAYTSVSLVRAYKAPMEDMRTRHIFAALFAGSFTIIGVIIGWISGLLIPAVS